MRASSGRRVIGRTKVVNSLNDVQRGEKHELSLIILTHALDMGLDGLDNVLPVL